MNQNEMIAAHEVSTILSKVNSEFLPLIQESNVIRVNQEPYVKLGVIGKGGSCKVYRALSKDCAVLAIKRVKTDDLDRKAIDGYANEIALLKRLRGNPAIIQLHDSEVDMTRQVILLVMEAGEADLNHVLQRQSIGQGNGQERSLNMNFIRLTWQVRDIVDVNRHTKIGPIYLTSLVLLCIPSLCSRNNSKC
jgi:serine/threonine protein kinase